MGRYASALEIYGRFLYASTFGSYLFVPKSKFTERDVPDLTEKVVIVTGGNAGIGKAICKVVLLEKNAKVYLATRSEARAKAAIAELLVETGKEASWLELDLSSLQSIEKAATEFHSKETKLHILFNNAGVLSFSDALTADGYDITFGTNVLGHFYFTELLIPALYRASTPEHKSRVINLSSQMGIIGVSAFGSGLDFSTFKDSPTRRKIFGYTSYSQSKLGNTVHTQEFARRYGNKIISVSVHPGQISAETLDPSSALSQFLFKLVLYPTPMGAITPLYGGTSPEVENLNGEYLTQWARLGTPRSNDPVLGKELWTWLEEQVEGREYLVTIRVEVASLN
ncbi:NAD(P)-binding protein [Thelephora ganbajun]|uniref:NAD(P)-binding protein n=1 Tax=Thelephora ganbajun TaxID=370292 RepID=A0ACB6ZR44_THEGA|nr:NAD(P)-binding protein [Thelephora ganbajun]